MRRLGVIPIATKFAPLALRVFFLSFSAQAREDLADEATSLAGRLMMEDGRRRRQCRGARRGLGGAVLSAQRRWHLAGDSQCTTRPARGGVKQLGACAMVGASGCASNNQVT